MKEHRLISLPSSIEEFAKKRDIWFTYLYNNYNTLICDTYIPHFDIIAGSRGVNYYDIKEKFQDELEKAIIPWIESEYDRGDMLNKNNWESMSHPEAITPMLLAYKNVFYYKDMIFKLILDYELCDDHTLCRDCRNVASRKYFFCLAYYEKGDYL